MNTTRFLSVGLVLAAASVATLGAAIAQEKTMAFSPLSLDIPAMQGLSGALNHFADDAGIGYMVLDPKFDPNSQAQQLA